MLKPTLFTTSKACLCAFSLLAFSAGSHAAIDKNAYDQAMDSAKSRYESAKKSCDGLNGNQKDVCVEEAKLERVKAESQAKVDYKNTADAQRDAKVDIAKAEYDLAKEKCDDMSGNAKDVCVKKAKADLKEAKAQAKAGEKVSSAKADAQETTNKANYKVEREKCDALSGNAKDSCVADAKARYHM